MYLNYVHIIAFFIRSTGLGTLMRGTFHCFMPIQRLLVKCPVSLKTALNVPNKDFEIVGSDNYLKLWTERSNYKEKKIYKDGGNQYIRSFTTPITKLKLYTREIKVKVVDERVILYDLIQLIARKSISIDLQTQTSVQIIDFVLPETQDRINAITSSTEPFTNRYGLIKNIVAGGGTVSDGMNAWLKDGFSFKFEELVLRHD